MVTYEKKGTLQNGQDVVHYTIENSKGTKVVISSLGATVVSLFVKNSGGELLDVVLGYDTIQEYLDDEPNFGTIVGRNCNRIANARFELNGKEYVLTQNDGTNNLHSGMDYYKLRVYEVQVVGDNVVVFSLFSPDGDQGFPGNLDFKVKYTLTEENGLLIEYEAVSDADTVVNPTSHGYFNLAGHAAGEKAAMSHILQLFSDSITPMGAASIPTGELRPIKDTPFDFNTPHALCERIGEEYDQLLAARGYDHNYVLANDGEVKLAAVLSDAEKKLVMEVYTDCPGIHLYTSNYLGKLNGKNGALYDFRGAVCLETQFFPNAINEPNFRKPIVKAGETYRSTTEYRFRQ